MTLGDDQPRDVDDIGLVGGNVDKRAARAKVPPLDHTNVLAPFRRDGDDERFRAFVAHRPLLIEIGFGRPHFLCDLADMRRDAAVVGFEVRRRWVRAATKRADRQQLERLRVVEGDARPYIERLVDPASVDAYYILFPDPWWKKRHHKRRLFQPGFLETLRETLVPGGALIARTDVPAYADLMFEQTLDVGGFELAARDGSVPTDPELAALPLTHREKKCRELGIPVFQFRFVRAGGDADPRIPGPQAQDPA